MSATSAPMSRLVCGVVAPLGALLVPFLCASTNEAAGAVPDRTVTYEGLTFDVPRAWVVVAANQAPCRGGRPIVIVGNYTSPSPTQCTAITDKPAEPTITIDTMPVPASSIVRTGVKSVERTDRSVHYDVTYGSGPDPKLLGVSFPSWGIAATFTGSPPAFIASGGGSPDSTDFKASMRILESVRASK